MNDDYAQDWDPEEEQEPSPQQPELKYSKSLIVPNKALKEKTSGNVKLFFTKFNGLFDRIYSTFAKTPPTPILREIIYSFYDKLFCFQSKFVLLKGANDFFLNPLNKSFLNDAFETHQRKSNELNDESPETTLKIFLKSFLLDPMNEMYLVRMKEFLDLLRETQKNFKKSKSLDNERMREAALKKYRKILKRKEGKRDEEILKLIIIFFEGKDESNNDNKNEQRNEENNDFLGRKINVEEKRMRTLKEVFLHYCRDANANGPNIKRNENMNIGGFLAFLRDFKISNEYMSKPKTLEIFRKTAGNLQESDFDSFVKILKRLSDFFYFNELEKSIEAKFVDLLIYMNLDDRIKIKEKLSAFTDANSNDLVAKQQKLKEMNISQGSALVSPEKQNKESDEEEEELKLEPMDTSKIPPKKNPLTPTLDTNKANNSEGHKKLNPLSAAKYKNATPTANNNRSKTKSPFRASKTELREKSIPPKENKNKPNLIPLNYTNGAVDIMKKSEKNQLYEKIFQRAQQLDLEEKIKHEERFNKLQNMNEERKDKNATPIKTKT